jgi:hypothetical protein
VVYLTFSILIATWSGFNANQHHMPKVPNWSSQDAVAKEAAKYQKRSQFETGSSGAYNVARKNGWLDEFFPKNNL